ncbi:sensor histidine kinase [Paenibacillus flagellatus]|uniref:histidine kinase n=1 Tax=Paenibacillus flagellatus TaxID=2211139 RepID=A0A2V5K838_9BACL|nr:HAMP domain-containing sensor histidine kinase [Paenibacillus flagellatus]PYI55631.1 two-component sensor histidine kinase [Paenibacillus flagellatus]
MLAYVKDFLLNLFFIFLPIVFYPHVLKLESKRVPFRAVLFVLFSVALVCTMSFPVVVNGMAFDFRIVPLVVGSLIGGPVVSALLFIVLVAYRIALGTAHPLLYALSVLPAAIVVIYFARNCNPFALYRKVAAAAVLSFVVRLLILVGFYALTNQLTDLVGSGFISAMPLIVVQSLFCGLYVYFMEYFRTNFYIQQEVIKSEKMKIVSDIAASVAHEIRNPLTSVRGFIQLLGANDLTPERKSFYRQICLEELDRAQKIISDYLSLAKPDPEHIETIDMEREVAYVCGILSSYANYLNIEIRRTTPDQPILISGDKFKLRQAIINIGKNAIEAMTENGVLEIELSKQDGFVLLVIKDNGIGMSADQLNRLGTPYYSTKDKGTGLGTMVSFGIIRKMQGTIDIQSEKWKGTTFTIAFPLVSDRSDRTATS